MLDWNDLKYFLAAYRAGGVNRASETLGVSASTVSRRLTALEESLGAPLFLRTPEGLMPTPAGEEILAAAEATEEGVHRLEAISSALQGEPSGQVRVAASPLLEEMVLLPALPTLLERHPRLEVEIISSLDVSDLTRREADLAVRTGRPTRGESLLTRRLRVARTGIYGERGYVARQPPGLALAQWRWLGLDSLRPELPTNQWLRAALPEVAPVYRGSSLAALRQAALAGLGLALLPEIFARATPALVEVPWDGPVPLPQGEVWLVGHHALRHSPRVRAVWDFLVSLIEERDGDAALLARRYQRAQGVERWRDQTNP